MKMAALILFWLSAFVIVWAMVGYPLSIKLLGKIFSNRQNKKEYSLVPPVTVLVVAHNEEGVIKQKLENLLLLDYPKEQLHILVASDNSTDATDEIVRDFARAHDDFDIRIHCTREHRGKTNAQNEAQKLVETDFLVLTDANAMLDKRAVRELMASFVSSDIAYVTGVLSYSNTQDGGTSGSEGSYWSGDVAIRDIESRIQTITAGNGALYACRNDEYFDADPIECHDSIMPYRFARDGKRAINCMGAVAYEKAGETDADEYARKVRMFRIIPSALRQMLGVANPFRYGWFSYFYFGHRACRYSLWWAHLLLLVSSGLLAGTSLVYLVAFVAQVLFAIVAAAQCVAKGRNPIIRMVGYYAMTVVAQWHAVCRAVSGRAKPTWEKAASTR